jgi:uncharacterized DUF497 family protein
MIEFEGDSTKAATNFKKHGAVSSPFSTMSLLSSSSMNDHSSGDEERFSVAGHEYGSKIAPCLSLRTGCRSHYSHHFRSQGHQA